MWYERYFTESFRPFICIEQMFQCFLTLFGFKVNNLSVLKRQAKVINHAAAIVQWHGAFYRPINIIFMWHAKYRSEEHTSELQSRGHIVCRLLREKKKRT